MSLMLSIHIVFLLIWSAGLVYFPGLFVRQAIQRQEEADVRFRTIKMQRTLYAIIMTPSALLAVAAGTWMIFERGFSGGWLQVKLALVLAMVLFHVFCGALMAEFKHEQVQRRLWFYRALPFVPIAMISAIVVLVTAKPF